MEIVGAWNASVRTCGEGGRKAVCTFLHAKGDGISASFREQCGGKGRKAMLRRYSMLGWFFEDGNEAYKARIAYGTAREMRLFKAP